MAVALALALLAVMCGASAAAKAPAPPVDCSVSFNDLMPCIDFVQGNSSAPPSTQCCTAFSNTQRQRPECLCQLQEAFADPAAAPGNATRAAEIPSFCKVAVDYSRCSTLLGLAPAPAPTLPPRLSPLPHYAPAPAPLTGKDYDCTNSFTELSSCLGFVSGDGKGGPPQNCCSALVTTEAKEPICICQLLAQANDSAQFGVNVTLAMQLPSLCHVTADTSQCPALLNAPLGAPVPVHAPVPSTSPAHAPVPAPVPSTSVLAPGPTTGENVDCSNEFTLLQSCFTYVMANDTTPPSVECCTSLGSVVTNKPVCLCQLLQTVGSGDPATSGINTTRALGLADVCKVTTDVSMCPALLGQPVSSPLPSTPLGAGPDLSPSDQTPTAEAPAASSRNGASMSVSSPSLLLWSVAILALLHGATNFC